MTASARETASAQIANRAGVLLAGVSPSSVIAVYAPKGSEVDTAPVDAIARAHGLRIVYPRVVDGDRCLAFHEAAWAELVPTRFGLREPVASRHPTVALAEIAGFVVPGLAFDRGGGRIGWGRGHYDATLVAASPSALRVGLAFECQVLERVEREPHDALLHYVVTELATYRTPQ